MNNGAVRVWPLALVAVGLAGCSNVAPADRATTGGAQPPVAATAPAARASVVLAGNGLELAGPTGGGTAMLAFGAPAEPVLRRLSEAMGGAPDRQGVDRDCGPGPLAFAGWSRGLIVYMQDERFVGWAGAVDLKTARGLGFGSTRGELDAAYRPVVEQGSLGFEFVADGISGVLESAAPDARVSELWAGMTCIAR